jgi:hypothetical protein
MKWKFKIGDEIFCCVEGSWYGRRGRISILKNPDSGWDYWVVWRQSKMPGSLWRSSQGMLEHEIEKVPNEQLVNEGLCQ